MTTLSYPAKHPYGSAAPESAPRKVLVIDVGGTNAKVLMAGQTAPVKFPSGKTLTPGKLVESVLEIGKDWDFEAVSVGYPGMVGAHGPRAEPGNLGGGWVGFDFAAAFGRPVRIINDSVLQALGSYHGGRMLFLGLGTGLGSTFIAENVIVALELGQLLHSTGHTLSKVLGRAGLAKIGKSAWRREVRRAVKALMKSFVVDYVILGGGNASKLRQDDLPAGVELGHNLTAFRGGLRLWKLEDVQTQAVEGEPPTRPLAPMDWRLL